MKSSVRVRCGICVLLLGSGGWVRAQTTADSLSRSQTRQEAERHYHAFRHIDSHALVTAVDVVVRGYDARDRTVLCTDGDSAGLRIVLRSMTAGSDPHLLIYAIAVGRSWRYLHTMRLLVDDWLLTLRPGALSGPELELREPGVIETIGSEITRRQLLLIARARSVQIRLVGGATLCDATLDAVSQELAALFVERELNRPAGVAQANGLRPGLGEPSGSRAGEEHGRSRTAEPL